MFTDKCAIIGYPLKPGELIETLSDIYEYQTEYVGRVIVTDMAFPALEGLSESDERRYIIAGICRYRTLNNEEPIRIDGAFVNGRYKKEKYPIRFEEKAYHFLKYIYTHGGKENHEITFKSAADFALAYASPDEFKRIMDYLESENQITISNKRRLAGFREHHFYTGVKLTRNGKDEAEKALPKMPMFGLVSQEITLGDTDLDQKINLARSLFFDSVPTLDKMRSACENLSYVLEPLRKDCEKMFGNKDTNTFFQLVNEFDIRHNKQSTKQIELLEQLEWVFYSLLNTINTYSKLKNK